MYPSANGVICTVVRNNRQSRSLLLLFFVIWKYEIHFIFPLSTLIPCIQHVQFWFGFMLKFLIHIEFKFSTQYTIISDSGFRILNYINILLALFNGRYASELLLLFAKCQNSSHFAMERNQKYKSMMLRLIVCVSCHIASHEMSTKKPMDKVVSSIHFTHIFYRWKFQLFPFSKNLYSSFVWGISPTTFIFGPIFVIFRFVICAVSSFE